MVILLTAVHWMLPLLLLPHHSGYVALLLLLVVVLLSLFFWTFYSSSRCQCRERIADRLLSFTCGCWLVIMFICINSKYINCVSFVPHHLVPAFGVWHKFPLRTDQVVGSKSIKTLTKDLDFYKNIIFCTLKFY